MKNEPKSLSKEACQARVASNWEWHQKAFVGKTDQEVRQLADRCFEISDDAHKHCPAHAYTPIVYGELDALKFAFAAEEELRRRGSNL